ncbi:NF038129 family PEP-CTERM protein [Massilia soli]|uniref:NF038129 family PEP-CTERM protein n=1 Tax=Massilia soli TaxID=2792854 RepID=A0ABS7SKY0_9BURK|nr:NF038129 family PEP-CTERM protein [Massilia soli]MBZ2206843.1 NF038129 family PEP-CTERM protein [Massilia soli]
MFNIQNLLRQAMLALVLCGASIAAHADVIAGSYRVTLNSNVAGATFLDMNFNGFDGAAVATATISNLQGAFNGVDSTIGIVGELPGGVFSIDNQGSNFLTHSITAGGLLSFDVVFSGAFMTDLGEFTSVFSAALLDADYMPLGNPEGDVIFSIAQLSAAGAAAVGIETFGDAMVTVNAVPEPSELLLMLTGLALMGAMVRRRQR